MKKKFIALLAALMTIAATSTLATAFTLDLSSLGGGVTNGIDYLQTQGINYVDRSADSDPFSFTNYSFFTSSTYNDSVSDLALGGGELTGISLTTGNSTGATTISFNPGGTLELWYGATKNYGTTTGFFGSNDGDRIGTFTVLNGAASIGTLGYPNGDVTVILKAESLRALTWFENGIDLSTLEAPMLVLGISTTNANPGISAGAAAELLEYAGVGTPGSEDLFFRSGGQFDVSAVPEPSTLILVGLGLAGAVAIRRKRN